MIDPNLNLCADASGADTYKKRIRVAAKFCEERHRVYIKKETLKREKPWTKDWILRSSRFCNIYRELDKVTVQIMQSWINPNLDNPDIASLAVLGRVINHPPTLLSMGEHGFTDLSRKPDSARLFKLFNKIKETDKLVTGAYIVNTIFPKGFPKIDGSKADYIANFLMPELHKKRHVLAEGLDSGSFKTTLDSMKKVHGIAAFLGNQAAVDLSYTKLLRSAKDIDTTWNPGPGTTKGINWIVGADRKLRGGTVEMDKALTTYMNDLNEELSKSTIWSLSKKDMKINLVPVSGPNCSNSLCELQKWVAMALGTRDRLKNNYNGS